MTTEKKSSIIPSLTREWRNRQTRTFEGRVFLRTGSSPVSRTRIRAKNNLAFIFLLYCHYPERGRDRPHPQSSVFALKTIINCFLYARHLTHQKNDCNFDTKLQSFFYPNRRFGISSRFSVHLISSYGAVYHHGIAVPSLSCGLMIYNALH